MLGRGILVLAPLTQRGPCCAYTPRASDALIHGYWSERRFLTTSRCSLVSTRVDLFKTMTQLPTLEDMLMKILLYRSYHSLRMSTQRNWCVRDYVPHLGRLEMRVVFVRKNNLLPAFFDNAMCCLAQCVAHLCTPQRLSLKFSR